MYRYSLLTATLLIFVLLLSCGKGGDDPILVPRVNKPVLKISGPTEVSLQKYRDTVFVPLEFRSSDSTKEIDVSSIAFTLPDNDLAISVGAISGRTPFKDTVRIYANPGVKTVSYVRQLIALYDTSYTQYPLLVRVVENTNCSFLFTGHYTFKQLLPSSPTPFISDVTMTGTNTGVMTNFANMGKSVQVTFDCGNELIMIPEQAFDAGTIHGSGSWGPNGLTINYTGFTGIYNYSGTIQGSR